MPAQSSDHPTMGGSAIDAMGQPTHCVAPTHAGTPSAPVSLTKCAAAADEQLGMVAQTSACRTTYESEWTPYIALSQTCQVERAPQMS